MQKKRTEAKPTEQYTLNKRVKCLGVILKLEPLNQALCYAFRKVTVKGREVIEIMVEDDVYGFNSLRVLYNEKPREWYFGGFAYEAMTYFLPFAIDDIAMALSLIIPRFDTVHDYGKKTWTLKTINIDHYMSADAVVEFPLEIQQYLKRIERKWNSKNVIQELQISLPTYEKYMKILKQMRDKCQSGEESKGENSEEKIFLELQEEHIRKRCVKKDITNKEGIIEAGERGEKEVDYSLKWIDQSFKIIKGIDGKIILYNSDYMDEAQQYDHIIVGPSGVFSVETKNYSGNLEIDSSGNWIREKNGEKKGCVNPIQQVRRHEKLLKSFLPDYVPVISFICMAGKEMIITGAENSSIPIVRADLLVEKIETYTSEVCLSEEQIEKCVQLINAHMIFE